MISTSPLAALDLDQLASLLQSGDVTASATAAREIEARSAAALARYAHSVAVPAVREYSITDSLGRVLGTAQRISRGAFDVQPAASTAVVAFDSLAAAREWLLDLAYLAR